MIADMKELIDKAKEMGYELVKYNQYEKKQDEVLKKRFTLEFESEVF